MTGSLDTNLLLRLVINDMPKEADLVKRLIESTGESFSVADIVFVELDFAMRKHYGMSRSETCEILLYLVASPSLNLNKLMLEKALPIYQSHPALSLVDIMLSIYANINNANPLWTFDKKLASQLPNAELLN